ncbi:hypothetical protein LOAG_00550 [Loa loa]|uniref:Uncharacterized protein n=1 Tax=Loa loa TaxID=7209 RepID=A0A1S0UD24_LOALO|nr:hypothetical protein LOAG_00550 [Loa loa]EFO27936.1 hypothetical protein LOAG_00550 [Loa loa]
MEVLQNCLSVYYAHHHTYTTAVNSQKGTLRKRKKDISYRTIHNRGKIVSYRCRSSAFNGSGITSKDSEDAVLYAISQVLTRSTVICAIALIKLNEVVTIVFK